MPEAFSPIDQSAVLDTTRADTDLSENKTYIEFSKRVDVCAEYIKQHPGLPILSHFTPIDNVLDMLDSSTDQQMGADSLRIRPANINDTLDIKVETGYGMGYAGTVSFFLSGTHSIEVDESNSAKSRGEGAVCAKFVPSYVVLLCPLRTVVKDDLNGANYQGGNEINIHFSNEGAREDQLKRGLNLLDPEVFFIIREEDEAEFKRHLETMPAAVRTSIEKKIRFVNNETAERIHKQITDHTFDSEFNDMLAKASGTTNDQLLELNAISSMFDIATQDLSKDSVEKMRTIVKIWKTDPVKGLLNEFGFPYTFKEVMQRLSKKNIHFPDRKMFFREAMNLASELTASI